MPSGVELPLEVAAMLCAGCAMAGGWIGHRLMRRRPDRRRDPVAELLKRDNLGPAVDLALHRNALRHASHAVLHGRIDQFARGPGRWSPDTAEAVRAHIAAVMRVGLRRNDRVVLDGRDGFTIIIPGVDERAAVHIAQRLRRRLKRLRLPHLGEGVTLTASFGVAADRFGEDREGLESRARRALDAALAQSTDHVVPASVIEEIMLLPAPTPSGGPAVSAA